MRPDERLDVLNGVVKLRLGRVHAGAYLLDGVGVGHYLHPRHVRISSLRTPSSIMASPFWSWPWSTALPTSLACVLWYSHSTFHAPTKPVQIVCQLTFSELSSIVVSDQWVWILSPFEDAVQMECDLACAACGENVWYARIGVKDVSSELSHLDEGEPNAIVDTWPKKGESR